MQIRRVVTGSVLAAGLGLAGLFGSATAFADNATNPTTNDAQGFAVTNHMNGPWNEGFNGIGHLRSEQTGAEVSSAAGTNRVREADPNTVNWQTPKETGKNGNKVTPQTKAGN